jgi:hypothetical protein
MEITARQSRAKGNAAEKNEGENREDLGIGPPRLVMLVLHGAPLKRTLLDVARVGGKVLQDSV